MAELQDWNITKAEWDGVAQRVERAHFTFYMLVLAELLVAAGMCAAWYFLTAPISLRFLLWIALALVILVVGSVIWARRTTPRWLAFLPVVWEARACACPWCRTRVDSAPCEEHGLSAQEQPQLLAYFEAMATQNLHALTRANDELRRTALRLRRPTSKWKIVWECVFGPYRRANARAMGITAHPDASLATRLRATVPKLLMDSLGLAVVVGVAYFILGRSTSLAMLSGCWWILPMTLVMSVVGPLWRQGPLRCAKCQHLCADANPTRCNECGDDLTRPAAVTRQERMPRSRWALLLVIPLLMMVFATGGFGVVSLLPLTTRVWCYSWIEPSPLFFQTLNVATLSPEEAAACADLLIARAAPDGPRPLFDFDFLANALAFGMVPQSTQEVAARAVVMATLEVETVDGVTRAIVVPQLGESIFGPDFTPRFVFGGVSIDGGAWSASNELSIMEHDLNDFWRARDDSPIRVLSESELRFVTPLDLAAGTHEIRARGWIVLWGPQWQRFTPTFDAEGLIVTTPKMSGVYEMELRESVTIR